MAGYAKKIDSFTSGRKGSDYGAVFPACRDAELRARVVRAIHTARSDEARPIDYDELREVATYISELEEFILRQNWGEFKPTFENLKTASGLDIGKRIEELNTLVSDE